jgi:5-methylthioadenosine/S-adenosylhomocysteine deaminase
LLLRVVSNYSRRVLPPLRPLSSGKPGRRYVIRGGAVMSMDPKVGDFPQADVLIEGNQIRDVKPNIGNVGGAGEIDARGRIVMPGFIDTHHHQFPQ